MENKIKKETSRTLRLLMPQWQGGNNPAYFLGSQLLNWLAPDTEDIEEEVLISLKEEGLVTEKGIFARQILLKQLNDAFDVLKKHDPERVVVFGGDCSVELAPIAYMNDKYQGDVALLWIDAHPDVDTSENQKEHHAHVLANLIGIGDEEFVSAVPKRLNSENVLFVGLTQWQTSERKVLDQLNMSIVSPEELTEDSSAVMNWLKSVNRSKVFIHFDLDVLDLREFRSVLGAKPDLYTKNAAMSPKGIHIETMIRLLQDVAKTHDVIGLGITEHFPWDAYYLKNMLERIPLIGDVNKKDIPTVNWRF